MKPILAIALSEELRQHKKTPALPQLDEDMIHNWDNANAYGHIHDQFNSEQQVEILQAFQLHHQGGRSAKAEAERLNGKFAAGGEPVNVFEYMARSASEAWEPFGENQDPSIRRALRKAYANGFATAIRRAAKEMKVADEALDKAERESVCCCEPDENGNVTYHRNCRRHDRKFYSDVRAQLRGITWA